MKFKDAQAKSVSLLSSPDFADRVKEEDASMIKHLDLLKNMNQYGYITTNSQGGKKSVGNSVYDGKSYEMNERAYITGFMLESHAIKFIQYLGIHTDKNAIFVPYCGSKIHSPSSLDVPLTITKKGGKTEVTTHMNTVLPFTIWEQERKGAKINKTEKIAYIFCWDTKWNRNASVATGLFTDVVSILRLINTL